MKIYKTRYPNYLYSHLGPKVCSRLIDLSPSGSQRPPTNAELNFGIVFDGYFHEEI